MKHLILKIKNKKLKGNVSLLIILVLLASSVIALLSINQIQHLLTYGNTTFNYFRSFYLAKAGTELGLTEVYSRGNGFENNVESGNKIVTENLVGLYTGFDPHFDMKIESNFELLTDDIRYTEECEGNEIILCVGSGIVLPLFKDVTSETYINNTQKILNETGNYSEYSNIDKLGMENLSNSNNNFTFGLFVFDGIDGAMKDVAVKTGSSLQTFLSDSDAIKIISDDSKYKYLTIKNSGTSDVKFCVVGKEKIPYSNSLISVRANYGDVEVGLQSIVKKEIPYWSLNVLGEDNN